MGNGLFWSSFRNNSSLDNLLNDVNETWTENNNHLTPSSKDIHGIEFVRDPVLHESIRFELGAASSVGIRRLLQHGFCPCLAEGLQDASPQVVIQEIQHSESAAIRDEEN